MPDPTKLAIPVPSEDPKKKKQEEKPEDAKDAAAKKKEEEKEGEELVCTPLRLHRNSSNTSLLVV